MVAPTAGTIAKSGPIRKTLLVRLQCPSPKAKQLSHRIRSLKEASTRLSQRIIGRAATPSKVASEAVAKIVAHTWALAARANLLRGRTPAVISDEAAAVVTTNTGPKTRTASNKVKIPRMTNRNKR